jgi:hypothetical protein
VKSLSKPEGILKPQMNAARQAATKERFKPDLPKRLAALRLSAFICGCMFWLRLCRPKRMNVDITTAGAGIRRRIFPLRA